MLRQPLLSLTLLFASVFRSAKLVHMNPLSPTVTVSQSSALLTSALSISRDNIAVSVLINLVSRGVEQIADGGFTVLQIAAGLLKLRYQAIQETANKTPIPIPVVSCTHCRARLTPLLSCVLLLVAHYFHLSCFA